MEEALAVHHYDDGNRAFLQAFMARGTLTFRDAQSILAAVFAAEEADDEAPPSVADQVTREDFESYMAAAGEALSYFDYEIRSSMHQTQNTRVYAIINTVSDPMTQLATVHTAEEIAFVRRVIEAMFDKYNSPRMEVMCLHEMQANKLRAPPRIAVNEDGMEDDEDETPAQTQQSQLKGLKSSEAEAMMRSMLDEGWFERSQTAGLYSLTPRALMELRSWLIESFNDPEAGPDQWQRIKFCKACTEIVTVGQRCADRECNVRIHDICQDRFWRTQREKKCPSCETAWTGTHFVGEKAVTETEAYKRGRRRSKGRSSNLMEQIMQDDDGEDEAEGGGADE